MTFKYRTIIKKMLADKLTPVQTYLNLRDRFQSCILLESTDFHAESGKFSFIACNPLAEIRSKGGIIEARKGIEELTLTSVKLDEALQEFSNQFEVEDKELPSSGLYGHVAFDTIPQFEEISFREKDGHDMPELKFYFYQYVIAFDHFHQTITFYENIEDSHESELQLLIETCFRANRMHFPFERTATEESNMQDADYLKMVEKGIKHCYRGDVFQMVLSRRFQQAYRGDDFNVYRTLRAINPSPYLFYFDFEDYRFFGSSPETQIKIKDGYASIDPIAGTVKRTGNPEIDELSKQSLLADEKENAEHVMLVDLARNDLSRNASEVEVKSYKEIQSFSHVMHIVSEVEGKLKPGVNPIRVFGDTFPAGTLSGAPKYRALELLDEYEPTKRNLYGGSVGFIGFNESINQAIFIRSFLSIDNQLYYQAGAGIVASSVPQGELKEVENKLAALRKAIVLAEEIEN